MFNDWYGHQGHSRTVPEQVCPLLIIIHDQIDWNKISVCCRRVFGICCYLVGVIIFNRWYGILFSFNINVITDLGQASIFIYFFFNPSCPVLYVPDPYLHSEVIYVLFLPFRILNFVGYNRSKLVFFLLKGFVFKKFLYVI